MARGILVIFNSVPFGDFFLVLFELSIRPFEDIFRKQKQKKREKNLLN